MAFHALCTPIACQHTSKCVRRAWRASTSATNRACGMSRQQAYVQFPRRHTHRVTLRASAGEVEGRVNQLSEEIKIFEKERDDATKTAETLAKTSVKLLDMIELLDKLALEKVTEGDDVGARNILKEKEEVKLMLDKTNGRAQNNFALAAKLAEAIGQKQSDLVSLLPSSTGSAEGYLGSEPAAVNPAVPSFTPNHPSFTPIQPFSIVPKWQASLEEARARLHSVEQEAQTEARLAQYGAEDTIAAAMSRIHSGQQDIIVHRERLRRTAEQSIVEARERLKKQEEEALEEIKWLMRRYRNGDHIPDYQLDSAFDKLQRRMYK